jgi:hypothetical protein
LIENNDENLYFDSITELSVADEKEIQRKLRISCLVLVEVGNYCVTLIYQLIVLANHQVFIFKQKD